MINKLKILKPILFKPYHAKDIPLSAKSYVQSIVQKDWEKTRNIIDEFYYD